MKKGLETRNRILDAAVELFSQKGYSAVTMSAVKEASGLSFGGLYKHFKSTKEIILAISERSEREVLQAISVEPDAEGEEILRTAIRHISNYRADSHYSMALAFYEFAMTEGKHTPIMDSRHKLGFDYCKEMLTAKGRNPDFSNEELEALALLNTIYFNGLNLMATSYDFTKEELDGQFSIMKKLFFQTGSKPSGKR